MLWSYMYTCNPSAQDAEAGGLSWFQASQGLHRETLKKKEKKIHEICVCIECHVLWGLSHPHLDKQAWRWMIWDLLYPWLAWLQEYPGFAIGHIPCIVLGSVF